MFPIIPRSEGNGIAPEHYNPTDYDVRVSFTERAYSCSYYIDSRVTREITPNEKEQYTSNFSFTDSDDQRWLKTKYLSDEVLTKLGIDPATDAKNNRLVLVTHMFGEEHDN